MFTYPSQAQRLLVVRGVAAVALGLVAFLWPGIVPQLILVLFSAFTLVDGVLALPFNVGEGNASRWPHLLEGITGIGIAILLTLLAVLGQDRTAFVLLPIVGAWAIVTGILEVVQAVRSGHGEPAQWLTAGAGVVAVFFSLGVTSSLLAGAVVTARVIGLYAMAFGILVVVLSLRPWRRQPQEAQRRSM